MSCNCHVTAAAKMQIKQKYQFSRIQFDTIAEGTQTRWPVNFRILNHQGQTKAMGIVLAAFCPMCGQPFKTIKKQQNEQQTGIN